jgi:hypothetical protein
VRILKRRAGEDLHAFRKRVTAAALEAGHRLAVVEAPETGAATLGLPHGSPIHIRLHCANSLGAIWEGRSPDPEILAAEQAAVANASWVSAPSAAAWRETARIISLPEFVQVFPNPVPDYAAGAPEAVRAGRVVLLARAQVLKGVLALPEILRHLRQCEGLRLIAAGEGMPGFVRALGLSDEVETTGELDAEGVRHLLGGAVVVLVPSLFETFSMVAAEALSAGTPVVTWAHTGAAELASAPLVRAVEPWDVEAFAKEAIAAARSVAPRSADFAAACQRLNQGYLAGLARASNVAAPTAATPAIDGRATELPPDFLLPRSERRERMPNTTSSPFRRKLRKLLRDPQAFFHDMGGLRDVSRATSGMALAGPSPASVVAISAAADATRQVVTPIPWQPTRGGALTSAPTQPRIPAALASASSLPVVVSFYAGADYYRQAAESLRADCDRLGMDHSIDELPVPEGFDWSQICRAKAGFYRRKLHELNRPILWLDVDSKLRDVPTFLAGANYDFAAFLRSFAELDPYRLVNYARQWVPGVIFLNTTPASLRFADSLAELAEHYPGQATDDYFLHEAWLRHRSELVALPIPPRFVDKDGSNPDGVIAIGNSGNVRDFKGKVDQHPNSSLANLRLTILSEAAAAAPTPAVRKDLYRRAWSNDVSDLDAMLKAATGAAAVDFRLAEQILLRASALHPKKFEARRMLTDQYIKRGEFLRARQLAEEMLESGYEDWTALARSRLADIALEERAAASGIPKSARIPMWWSKGPNPGNFGDILNPYIVEKLTGVVPLFAPRGKGLLAIGSIIKFADAGTTVWGTGSSRRGEPLNPAARYRSVRGPITRDIIRQSGGWCDKVYGDAALLMPRFYDPATRKRHKLGYIPHYVHHGEQIETDAHVLNILRASYDDIEAFIRELKECEAVVSTSLHGIILANAYGIPARWATFAGSSNRVSGDDMKYEDYFLSVGMPVQSPLNLAESRVLDSARACAAMDRTVDLKISLDAIKDAFPWDMADAARKHAAAQAQAA